MITYLKNGKKQPAPSRRASPPSPIDVMRAETLARYLLYKENYVALVGPHLAKALHFTKPELDKAVNELVRRGAARIFPAGSEYGIYGVGIKLIGVGAN